MAKRVLGMHADGLSSANCAQCRHEGANDYVYVFWSCANPKNTVTEIVRRSAGPPGDLQTPPMRWSNPDSKPGCPNRWPTTSHARSHGRRYLFPAYHLFDTCVLPLRHIRECYNLGAGAW